jgi:hypothetical protein
VRIFIFNVASWFWNGPRCLLDESWGNRMNTLGLTWVISKLKLLTLEKKKEKNNIDWLVDDLRTQNDWTVIRARSDMDCLVNTRNKVTLEFQYPDTYFLTYPYPIKFNAFECSLIKPAIKQALFNSMNAELLRTKR